MNERIKELALKAYNNAGQSIPDELSLFMQVYSEKFAELIITEFAYECMDVTSMPEHINFLAKEWNVEL